MPDSFYGYAILGGGRLARHMRHYFSLLDMPCHAWARNPHSKLNSFDIADPQQRLLATVADASHVLLLVADDAISNLLKRYPVLHGKTLLHCSGALSIPGVAGAHPLMTFGTELYSLETYQKIPFMLDQGLDMKAVLPGLPNPHSHIAVDKKAEYHALCVMAGNFPQILWQATASRLTEMGLPENAMEPYLLQVMQNFISSPTGALTGPLSRGDTGTVKRNLQALEGDGLQALYQSFVEFHNAENQQASLREIAL